MEKQPVIHFNSQIDDARHEAGRYEATLDPTRRKHLGQFFTGLRLGRLLASIALERDASTVIDPMAGHGDLLDAVIERAVRQGNTLRLIQGVEIDMSAAEVCNRRIAGCCSTLPASAFRIRGGDAFDPGEAHQYASEGYDLVITNPPYVRYQTLAGANGDSALRAPVEIRRALREIVGGRVAGPEWPIWRTLIESYSGLADLSVPAWILAAALVRPGGVLALVAPATWRSRDYGDIIAYLLARCFRLEYLIEDTQPGWFSDALVRTQLVIARRYPSNETCVPLLDRVPGKHFVTSARVSPRASSKRSLVAAAFPGEDPEHSFAGWLRCIATSDEDVQRGLSGHVSLLNSIIKGALAHLPRRTWFRALEPSARLGSLFPRGERSSHSLVPQPLLPLLEGLARIDLVTPSEAQLSFSQGLRTGCNGFFYVELVQELQGHMARVRLSELFDREETVVPSDCLVPVVRRQSEISGPVRSRDLVGRALDLTSWVLPEDAVILERTRRLYAQRGRPIAKTMPDELANLVRRAANTAYKSDHEAKRIPELSAVKTNVRNPRGGQTPRFWYMLPPFTRRHRPDAFVARVNQGIPWIDVNDVEPVLVDANFTAIFSESTGWTRFALRALLNSSWCRACMEALGTPLGGGALKLEATHLRRLPLPILTAADLAWLDAEGQALLPDRPSESVDRLVIERITGLDGPSARVTAIANELTVIADDLCRSRQKKRI